ncbi:MAG TPA: hypothetical protein VGH88_03685 [Streptosporangiaceae bacterium]|jgi:hypothetical protein
MPFNPANHFVVSGAGIDGTVDITSVSGEGLVSVTVDGRALRAPSLGTTREGLVIRAIHEEDPDSHTLVVTMTIPQVNIDAGPQTGAGFAVLTTARTSIGGPGLVSGPLQLFELRPLTVTASGVES